jgi:hypothetical protein
VARTGDEDDDTETGPSRPADDEDVAAADPDSPGAALAVEADEIPEPNEPG